MSKYRTFVFEDYHFDKENGVLNLHYGMDDALRFREIYRFDFDYADYDEAALDRAFQALFFMAGVSYYKMYVPPEIVIKKGELDPEMAAFFSKTYQRGLGEFWYLNQMDAHTPVLFPPTTTHSPALNPGRTGQGLLVAIGGGKDSLVSIEILRAKEKITTWSLNHRPQLTPLVEQIALPHAWVERTWDPKIMELNKQDALNGHIPISAIFACVGVIVAILAGKRDVVMSNEQSANEPTLHYQGVAINHQYSKSQEFERDFQQYLQHTLGEAVRYYSFLRPLSEVRIGELFARVGFEKYKDVFSSCNRAFVHTSDHMSWCGECSKCAFVYMALAPFVPAEKLNMLWNGKNLLLDPALEPTYRKLLGIEGDKPLDCVGDIKESRAAMRLAQEKYPELREKYHFDIPEDYDFRAVSSHEMPEKMYEMLKSSLVS
ncbi:MAG TPA: hypothetical protein VL737_02845 [Candidatus Pristimantibacillus sp.]|nr:hypothetical protein [Candidatus Pristimantibacillus sp.]